MLLQCSVLAYCRTFFRCGPGYLGPEIERPSFVLDLNKPYFLCALGVGVCKAVTKREPTLAYLSPLARRLTCPTAFCDRASASRASLCDF